MIISLVQMDVKAGLPAQNIKTILSLLEKARKNGSEIAVFSELCVGGYLTGDRWLEDDFLYELLAMNEIIRNAAGEMTVVFGNVAVEFDKRGNDGRPVKYNAAYVVQNGEISFEAKTLLPNYRIFDDRRYFTPRPSGKRRLYSADGKKFGVTVCEDMWSNDYDTDPVIELIDEGADFIINISASPWTYGKNNARDRQIQILENKSGKLIPFYYVNNVGVQNNGKNIITFDGDSAVYVEGGRVHAYDLKPYEQGIIRIDDSSFLSGRDTRGLPGETEQKYNAIIRGIQGFDELLGSWKPNYIIGLSGGVDSSLVAALMTKALGKERVLGFNLPGRYNSSLTKDSAAKLAANLGIRYRIIPIEKMAEVNKEILRDDNEEFSSLVEENIQAKIRGTSILSNLAAIHSGLMTNNGNKLETALGYATLYGDVNGALAPIGDLTKEEVFAMCRWLNEKENIIPEELLPDDNYDFIIPPSAELKENQRDPIKFGYHDRLIAHLMDYRKKSPEQILEWYISGKEEFCEKMGITGKIFSIYNLDDGKIFTDDLEWFVKTMRLNIFKRIQAPPIILLSRTAFGFDLRESQFIWQSTARYLKLRKQILEPEGKTDY